MLVHVQFLGMPIYFALPPHSLFSSHLSGHRVILDSQSIVPVSQDVVRRERNWKLGGTQRYAGNSTWRQANIVLELIGIWWVQFSKILESSGKKWAFSKKCFWGIEIITNNSIIINLYFLHDLLASKTWKIVIIYPPTRFLSNYSCYNWVWVKLQWETVELEMVACSPNILVLPSHLVLVVSSTQGTV